MKLSFLVEMEAQESESLIVKDGDLSAWAR